MNCGRGTARVNHGRGTGPVSSGQGTGPVSHGQGEQRPSMFFKQNSLATVSHTSGSGQGRPPIKASNGVPIATGSGAPVTQEMSKQKKILTKGWVDRSGDESELQVEDFVKLPMPKLNEIGTKGGKLPVVKGHTGFICNVKFDNPEEDLLDEDEWVFCRCCYVMSHLTCIKFRRCICGFKPLRRDLM